MTTDSLKDLLLKRKIIQKAKPVFRRSNIKRAGIPDVWRKPMGRHNKIRANRRGEMPTPGFGVPKKVRGYHASGFIDVIVRNTEELKNIDSKIQVARIAHGVGTKKRLDIIENAKKLGVRILNPSIKAINHIKAQLAQKRVESKKAEPKKEDHKAEIKAKTEQKKEQASKNAEKNPEAETKHKSSEEKKHTDAKINAKSSEKKNV